MGPDALKHVACDPGKKKILQSKSALVSTIALLSQANKTLLHPF